jgi:hypothetical protein
VQVADKRSENYRQFAVYTKIQFVRRKEQSVTTTTATGEYWKGKNDWLLPETQRMGKHTVLAECGVS